MKNIITPYSPIKKAELIVAIILLILGCWLTNGVVENYDTGIGRIGFKEYKSPTWVIIFGSFGAIVCLTISTFIFVLFLSSKLKKPYLVMDSNKISWPSGLLLNRKNQVLYKEILAVDQRIINNQLFLKIETSKGFFLIRRKALSDFALFDEILSRIKKQILVNKSFERTR